VTELRKFDYFLLRYVPNVVREEFVNIGLVMTESGGERGGFAGAHFTKDWRWARRIDPHVDIEVLEALGREVERRLSDAQQRAALLYEMMDSYSNLIQLSPLRHCLAEDPARELKDLAIRLVEMPGPGELGEEDVVRKTGRRWIYAGMSQAFRTAGVWDLMTKNVPASAYTNAKDDFTFDFGYAFGEEIKIFHAVSLVEVGLETRMFPLRVAKIGPRMARLRNAKPQFTAVVEDSYDGEDPRVMSVLAFMEDERIRVAGLQEMGAIAQMARLELGA
jgi:hypothetical protein